MKLGLQASPTLHRLEPGPQRSRQTLVSKDGRAQLKDEHPHLAQRFLGRAAQLEQVLRCRVYLS